MRRGILAVAGVAFGALATLVVLATLPPTPRPELPPDADARGEAFEQALAAAITKVRPEGEESWAIAIDPDDVNAWLATRLPKWIAHDPTLAEFSAATEVRIAADEGALVVEAPVGPAFLGLVGTVRVPIALDEAMAGREVHDAAPTRSALRIEIGNAQVGRLPVPAPAATVAAAGGLADELLRLDARHPDRSFALADGRRIEVRALACEGGRIRIRFATRPAAASGG